MLVHRVCFCTEIAYDNDCSDVVYHAMYKRDVEARCTGAVHHASTFRFRLYAVIA